MVKTIHRNENNIIFLVSHNMNDIAGMSDKVLVMDHGKLVMDGTPEQVVSQAAGKVWECHVDASEAERMSTCMAVGNVRYSTDGHAVVRVVSDEAPTAEAHTVDPTLEDLYLHVFSDADTR